MARILLEQYATNAKLMDGKNAVSMSKSCRWSVSKNPLLCSTGILAVIMTCGRTGSEYCCFQLLSVFYLVNLYSWDCGVLKTFLGKVEMLITWFTIGVSPHTSCASDGSPLPGLRKSVSGEPVDKEPWWHSSAVTTGTSQDGEQFILALKDACEHEREMDIIAPLLPFHLVCALRP